MTQLNAIIQQAQTTTNAAVALAKAIQLIESFGGKVSFDPQVETIPMPAAAPVDIQQAQPQHTVEMNTSAALGLGHPSAATSQVVPPSAGKQVRQRIQWSKHDQYDRRLDALALKPVGADELFEAPAFATEEEADKYCFSVRSYASKNLNGKFKMVRFERALLVTRI